MPFALAARKPPASLCRLAIATILGLAASARADDVATAQPTTAPAGFFDTARHMRVSEIRDGMKGYGLTVLRGTTIERFPVEVVSVLHNVFGPGQDVVMIRCTDAFMQHVGPIAGCSGSPIYLYDDSGRERLIGAYALGFDAAKDPIIGVQPIEAMLTLVAPPPAATSQPAGDNAASPMSARPAAGSWSLLDANVIPWLPRVPELKPGVKATPLAGAWRPLAVPLAVRGAGAASIVERLAPMLRERGFEPLAAPTTAGGADPATAIAATMQPGAVLAGAMLTGDLEMTALGTCTEVIDGRAFGFGHPFNGEGATSVPMATGAVNLVMPTLVSSFKIGSAGTIVGTIDNDGAYGVAGQIGAAARTFPITVTVVDDTRRGWSHTYRYQSATHRLFSPIMAGGAVQASLVAEKPLPIEHTVRYDVTITFDDDRTLRLRNVATSLDQADVARDVAWPVQMMMNNPFVNVAVREVVAHARITGDVEADKIESAASDRTVYLPGETARLLVRVQRYRGEPFTRVIELPIPATLADGDYNVIVGDATNNLAAESASAPYQFTVRDVDELFAGLTSIARLSNNAALYVRLTGISEGLAIGRTPLDRLPPSRRAILGGARRPDASPLAGARVTIVPSDRAIQGGTQVTLRVRKKLP